jgi:hypothetical protein
VEIDAVAAQSETWLVEWKLVLVAVAADDERFRRKREFFERATGRPVNRPWIVAQASLNSEACEWCEVGGVDYSGNPFHEHPASYSPAPAIGLGSLTAVFTPFGM